MLKYNLTNLFRLRNIRKPHLFLMNAGISRMVAYKFLRDDVHVVRLDHIETLCKVLKCTPNDLFRYIPDKAVNPNDPQPIEKLIKEKEEFVNIPDIMASLNLEEMREFNKIISNYKKVDKDNAVENDPTTE